MADYGIDDIQSLDFREGVRSRVAMYLGSDDLDGAYQAFKEIINNSTDEAIAGFGQKIEIQVSEKINQIKVRDYGRGIPFGVREDGENVLVSVFTKSHTGGKFNESVYKNVSGLNGIGAKCVCLSSSAFDVFSYRDGRAAHAAFKKGLLISYGEHNTDKPNGTLIEFIPDKEVFKTGDINYTFKKICEDIHDISYLYKGIEFSIKNIDTNKTETYKANNGIVDFVKDNLEKSLHTHVITYNVKDGEDSMEIAFQWGSPKEESYVFVNGLRCVEGGSPITGAKSAITRTFNSLSGENFDGDSIRSNLFYVINCSVAHPSFSNQTKSKINNSNLRTMASTAFSSALKDMKTVYPNEFDTIITLLQKLAKADAAAEKARKTVLEATKDIEKNQKRKVFASDKLKDAEHLGQDSILLVCEGKGAVGAMAKARDYTKYGLLEIRGKLINCLSSQDEDIYKNEEIKLLLSAMNITPGKYDSKKLRYGRIGICADSDSDGAHIGLLIASALWHLAPEFVREGRLCWLRAPLFVVTNKGKRQYYYTESEYNLVRGKTVGEVSRNKGLGEMGPDEARESMFDPKHQRLDVLEYTPEAAALLKELMGDEVTPRRDFIFENVDFTTITE